jgi:transposase-like protein
MRRNRPALFRGRHFEAEIIVLCVRWYLRFGLSFRNLEEINDGAEGQRRPRHDLEAVKKSALKFAGRSVAEEISPVSPKSTNILDARYGLMMD